MITGLVKWYSQKLGYGFIAVAPGIKREFGIPAESDLYVHANALVMKFPKVLHAEQKVAFTIAHLPKGPCAVGVRVVSDTHPAPRITHPVGGAA